MSLVLKFTPFDLAWSQRQTKVFAFEGLDPRQLIGTHGHFSLLGSYACLFIDLTERFDLLFAPRIVGRGQPIADQMRLEIPFCKRRAACRGEICLMMPRRIASSAISRPVHWLMGRALGCSHAIAIN
jgi:hypothetical protein